MIQHSHQHEVPTWDPRRPFPRPVETTFEAAGRSLVGRRRERNEDHFAIAELYRRAVLRDSNVADPELFGEGDVAQGLLLVVADGMGGHGNGETASLVAVRTVARRFLERMPWLSGEEGDIVRSLGPAADEAVQSAHGALMRLARTGRVAADLGTTVTLAYVVWPNVLVAHVGDSRCYLWREGELSKITNDHTVAEQIRRQFAETPPKRYEHVLSNAIGGTATKPEVELHTMRLLRGDRLLLCSDGLFRDRDTSAVAEVLAGAKDAETCVERLVGEARAAGAKDDVTAVVGWF